MTTSRDPDRLIRAFLAEGDETLQDRVYDVVRAEIEHKPQRAGIGLWRTPTMNKIVTIGLGAAAVVVIGILLSSQLLGSPAGFGGPGDPTATPEATATPEPSVAEPTSTPEAGLPQGPIELVWDGLSDRAPRITVTITASGWTEDGGILGAGDESDNLPEAAILAYSEPPGTAFYVWGDPCRWPSTRPETPATTVEEIAAALAAQPSRDATEPVDIAVDGHPGKLVTLKVPDDVDVDGCEGGEFATFGTETDDLARYQQGPGQIDDLWIIDVDGAIVIFDAMYRPDSRTDIVDEMRTIVESATFEVP